MAPSPRTASLFQGLFAQTWLAPCSATKSVAGCIDLARAWDNSGQYLCQSSGRRSIRVRAEPVACSIATQYSTGTPRTFQLPSADGETPRCSAKRARPPNNREALSIACSPAKFERFKLSIHHANTIRVRKSTPRVHTYCVESPDMKTIGERIRQAREAKGLSGHELAKMVGYEHQSAIGNLENRVGGSGGHKLSRIADALNVSVEWLLKGPDSNTPQPPSSQPTDIETQPSTVIQSIKDVDRPWNGSSWPFLYVTQQQYFTLTIEERQHIESDILIRLKARYPDQKHNQPDKGRAAG
jgi:transcriptional regulator with XRE-family HTH domain